MLNFGWKVGGQSINLVNLVDFLMAGQNTPYELKFPQPTVNRYPHN